MVVLLVTDNRARRKHAQYMKWWYHSKADKKKIMRYVRQWENKNSEKAKEYRRAWNSKPSTKDYKRLWARGYYD